MKVSRNSLSALLLLSTTLLLTAPAIAQSTGPVTEELCRDAWLGDHSECDVIYSECTSGVLGFLLRARCREVHTECQDGVNIAYIVCLNMFRRS